MADSDNWADHELVRAHMDEFMACARERGEIEVIFHGSNWTKKVHGLASPIEALFSLWWCALGFHGCDLWLHPQLEVSAYGSRYRLDFAVTPMNKMVQAVSAHLGKQFKFAIELDGHEFHERTKEQVALRNKRDRALQDIGWKVYHVSGSELVRNGRAVVEDVQSSAAIDFTKFETELTAAVIGKVL